MKLSPIVWLQHWGYGNTRDLHKLMKQLWLENPSSVPDVWNTFFTKLFAEATGAKVTKRKSHRRNVDFESIQSDMEACNLLEIQRVLGVYQFRSHAAADLDPFHIKRPKYIPETSEIPRSDTRSNKQLPLNREIVYRLPENCFVGGEERSLPLYELIKRMNKAYCRNVGLEYMYNSSYDIAQWLRRQFEDPRNDYSYISPELKKRNMSSLIKAQYFEDYMEDTFPSALTTQERGPEVVIALLKAMTDHAALLGGRKFIIGVSADRVRLNVFANVATKPIQQVYIPFLHHKKGRPYHLRDVFKFGTYVAKNQYGTPIEYSIVAGNNSVQGLVSGRAKAFQQLEKDSLGDSIWPIIIHSGDVMKCDGSWFENDRLGKLPSYETFGTIHVVLSERSDLPSDIGQCCRYNVDIAKSVMAPVIHVNSQDPDAMAQSARVAAEYRRNFKSDIILHVIYYDFNIDKTKLQTPSEIVTIAQNMQPIVEVYSQTLTTNKILQKVEILEEKKKFSRFLEAGYDKAKRSEFRKREWLESPWRKFHDEKLQRRIPNTGIPCPLFDTVLEQILNYTPSISVNTEIASVLKKRYKKAKDGLFDWAMAESMAIAIMLQEQISVRIMGKDCEQGVNSRRHHVLYDTAINQKVVPLNTLFQRSGQYELCNTRSSEPSSLMFAQGYAQTDPYSVVIWEADTEMKLSSAQYVFDEIARSEKLWFKQSGLICLIPHGLEGKGNEFSSARPERFLQMCNDDYVKCHFSFITQMFKCNWVIACVTTPANYFHLLLRSVRLNYRKPVILFTHRGLLSDERLVSEKKSLVEGSNFQAFLGDIYREDYSKVTKILLCTGKIYYELFDERLKNDPEEKITICRLEQLSPFPYLPVFSYISRFINAKVYWVQEEPKNQGWWLYVRPRILRALQGVQSEIDYIGSPTSSRIGSNIEKYQEQKTKILKEAMSLG